MLALHGLYGLLFTFFTLAHSQSLCSDYFFTDLSSVLSPPVNVGRALYHNPFKSVSVLEQEPGVVLLSRYNEVTELRNDIHALRLLQELSEGLEGVQVLSPESVDMSQRL